MAVGPTFFKQKISHEKLSFTGFERSDWLNILSSQLDRLKTVCHKIMQK